MKQPVWKVRDPEFFFSWLMQKYTLLSRGIQVRGGKANKITPILGSMYGIFAYP